jgi:hypothetical protein
MMHRIGSLIAAVFKRPLGCYWFAIGFEGGGRPARRKAVGRHHHWPPEEGQSFQTTRPESGSIHFTATSMEEALHPTQKRWIIRKHSQGGNSGDTRAANRCITPAVRSQGA